MNSMDVPVTTYNDNSDDVNDWPILMININNKKITYGKLANVQILFNSIPF